MRISLTIFVSILLVIFSIILFSLTPLLAIREIGGNGQVLGAAEANEALNMEDLRARVLGLPENNTVNTVLEEEITGIIIPQKEKNYREIEPPDAQSVVIDAKSGIIMFEHEADRKKPIASITKLATALTFLDLNPGWDKYCQIIPEDVVEGGKIFLRVGEEAKIKDLFYLSLIGSANTATKALVRSTGKTEEEFIQTLNGKMKELGLIDANFVDTVGFSPQNVATAREVAILAQAALENEDISEATQAGEYEFFTKHGRRVTVSNTNWLLDNYPDEAGTDIVGGKTGYTVLAGYCFVGKFIDIFGHELISVVLGNGDKNSRFKNTKKLINWAYDNYNW